MSEKQKTILYKVLFSILFGLIGFIVNWLPLELKFPPHVVTFDLGYVFPMLVAYFWGWPYALISATLGLACQNGWWEWQDNGWALLVNMPLYTCWPVFHGYIAKLAKKYPDKKYLANKYLVEIVYSTIQFIGFFIIGSYLMQFNPSLIYPHNTTTAFPTLVKNLIAIKMLLNAFIVIFLADYLMQLTFIRKLFLHKKVHQIQNYNLIIGGFLLAAMFFWVIDACYVTFFPAQEVVSLETYQRKSFFDNLIFDVNPDDAFHRFVFLFFMMFLSIQMINFFSQEEELKEKIELNDIRFKEFFKYVKQGVAIYKAKDNGNKFIIEDFNPEAEKIEKVKREEIIGKSVEEVFPGVKEFGIFDLFKKVYQTGKVMEHPMKLYKDNRLQGYRENIIFRLPSGEVAAVYSDLTPLMQTIEKLELSERKIKSLNEKLEDRVKSRTKELAEVNQELESFVYSVSHDLRAPLRHITGFSQILLDEYKEKVTKKMLVYLNKIMTGANELNQLIDGLLQISRLGRKVMEIKAVDFNILIKDVLEELKPDYDKRDIIWKIDKFSNLACDPILMKVVLENLLSNAIKFSKDRERTIIEIRKLTNNSGFLVKDNGVGFDMKYVDKIFDPFQRLHSDEKFAGTGIGLATVHRIIKKHGGEITALGAVDQGATFTVKLSKLAINQEKNYEKQ